MLHAASCCHKGSARWLAANRVSSTSLRGSRSLNSSSNARKDAINWGKIINHMSYWFCRSIWNIFWEDKLFYEVLGPVLLFCSVNVVWTFWVATTSDLPLGQSSPAAGILKPSIAFLILSSPWLAVRNVSFLWAVPPKSAKTTCGCSVLLIDFLKHFDVVGVVLTIVCKKVVLLAAETRFSSNTHHSTDEHFKHDRHKRTISNYFILTDCTN